MISKKVALETLEQMPNQFDIDELMDRLYFMARVEKGQEDVKEGRVYEQEEAKQKLGKWLK